MQNLRVEMKNKGWLRAIPEKDGEGEIVRWYVALTNAAPDHLARANAISRDLEYSSQNPDHDSPDHDSQVRARETFTTAVQNGSLTPGQAAAVQAMFPQLADAD